ncbi:transcriptional regulator [Paenibacillus sinopodophylli]|uniref:transcriptional regulator n=1 Tax=Paenibacillus sinopodophylli TaxID=1837342 RepID=UPI00110CC538|nr:transcriptional regulator [Paenibacillus sinopodophylli]
MALIDTKIEKWITKQFEEERNPRRRELLRNGLGHGTLAFLKTVWYPAIGSFEHLYPEWEVRTLNKSYRYLDLAYMPGGAKGCIEIHGYRSHARDIEAWRFKDLCMKQALLSLDDWLFLPIAYLSIKEEPEICKQLSLSFVGKFVSMPVSVSIGWAEAETLRFARRLLRPFTSAELSSHLQRTDRQTRRTLQKLIDEGALMTNGKQRYRTYQSSDILFNGHERNLENLRGKV